MSRAHMELVVKNFAARSIYSSSSVVTRCVLMETSRLAEEHEESDESEEPDITTDPNEECNEQEQGISASNTGEPAENAQENFLQAWRKSSQDRPLRVLVCGLGGVGKSTLINRLLQLEGERQAEEGIWGRATTAAVSKYETTTKSGVKVCVFDTPGFGDINIRDETAIAMMEDKTEKKLDMVFYCISLNGPARVQQGDVQAITKMTRVFTDKIWENAVIVLTFANVFEERVANIEEYKGTISRITEKVRQVLRNEARVREEIVAQLPIITAGHTEPTLKYEAEECESMEGWDNRLFLEALKQVNPDLLPALFAARFGWKDAVAALGGGGGGAAVGGGAGAVIGALIGAPFGGPAGAAVGAVVGGGIGAGVGGAGGAGTGFLVYQAVKIRSILRVKYEKWKLQRKSTS